MKNKFLRKATAVLATVGLVGAGAVTLLAAPASASTPTGCETAFCYTGLPVDTTGLTAGSPPDFTDGPYSLGQSFTVAHQGNVWAICFPVDAGEANDNVFLTNGSTTFGPVVATPAGSGQSCGFMFAHITAGTWMAYYSVKHDYYQTTGGATGSTGGGELTMNGGYYASSGVPNAGAGAYNFGINLYFQSNPNMPTTSSPGGTQQQTGTTLSVPFVGDGVAGATYTASCTSSKTGPFAPVSGPSSPLVITGVSWVADQTITCAVTESVTAFFTLVSDPGYYVVSMHAASGPGCKGTVTAPTQLTAAAMAFPGAVVSWAPVAADPSSCLSGYLVTPTSGSTAGTPTFVSAGSTTTHVLGLTLGSSYTFTVAAVTGSGVGPQSDPVGPVTIGTPAAVTSVHVARVGQGAVKVAFKAGSNNGAAITGFIATCGGKSTLGRKSPLIVKGLKAGRTYTCTVRAANSRGTGAAARSANVKA